MIDDENKIWVSSYNGIYFFKYPYLDIIKLNPKNALINQEFNYKSAAKLINNQLIFGGLNGYDIISSNLFRSKNETLKGKILGYNIYGLNSIVYKNYIKSEIIEYNTKNYYLELYFSMEKFEKFKSSNFEYQIDDRPWVPLLGYSYLYMYNLKDGIHTINIRGLDEEGNPIVFDTIKVVFIWRLDVDQVPPKRPLGLAVSWRVNGSAKLLLLLCTSLLHAEGRVICSR